MIWLALQAVIVTPLPSGGYIVTPTVTGPQSAPPIVMTPLPNGGYIVTPQITRTPEPPPKPPEKEKK